eukprot:1442670-Prymnesium_polylepis.2
MSRHGIHPSPIRRGGLSPPTQPPAVRAHASLYTRRSLCDESALAMPGLFAAARRGEAGVHHFVGSMGTTYNLRQFGEA